MPSTGGRPSRWRQPGDQTAQAPFSTGLALELYLCREWEKVPGPEQKGGSLLDGPGREVPNHVGGKGLCVSPISAGSACGLRRGPGPERIGGETLDGRGQVEGSASDGRTTTHSYLRLRQGPQRALPPSTRPSEGIRYPCEPSRNSSAPGQGPIRVQGASCVRSSNAVGTANTWTGPS